LIESTARGFKPRCEGRRNDGVRCTLGVGHPSGPFAQLASRLTDGAISPDGHMWET
jgi:hypothetical protein